MKEKNRKRGKNMGWDQAGDLMTETNGFFSFRLSNIRWWQIGGNKESWEQQTNYPRKVYHWSSAGDAKPKKNTKKTKWISTSQARRRKRRKQLGFSWARMNWHPGQDVQVVLCMLRFMNLSLGPIICLHSPPPPKQKKKKNHMTLTTGLIWQNERAREGSISQPLGSFPLGYT